MAKPSSKRASRLSRSKRFERFEPLERIEPCSPRAMGFAKRSTHSIYDSQRAHDEWLVDRRANLPELKISFQSFSYFGNSFDVIDGEHVGRRRPDLL